MSFDIHPPKPAPTGDDLVKLNRKDFQAPNDVRWCPGCGDYAILATFQRFLPELGIPRENLVVVSGIGCAARFPYYMETYGMHTVHGRAPSIATGLKLARPELEVWLVSGDGDSLSIGGNHTLHMLRRNVNLKVMLFNNQIYGLTKGQYSPSSEQGKVTKSTPMGSIDAPVNPARFAMGCDATFYARTADVDVKHMLEVLRSAHDHEGTAFIEILQNCVVFNDGAFEHVSNKKTRKQNNIYLQHGEPLLYDDGKKGIAMGADRRPTIIDLEKEPERKDEIVVHDEQDATGTLGWMYASMQAPEFPTPLGVFRKIARPTYDGAVHAQVDEAVKKQGEGDLKDLLFAGDTWTVD